MTRLAAIGLTAAGAGVGCGGPNPGPAPRAAATSPEVTEPPVSPVTPVVSPPVSVLPLEPPPPVPTMHGHFRGTATRGSDVVHTEILIAADGAFRLYLGAPDPEDGVDHGGNIIPWLLGPADPMQVRGDVVLEDERASGAGTLVGENCSLATDRPACAASANVELDLHMVRGIVNGVAGELRVGAPLTATWEIDTTEFNYSYRSEARSGIRSFIVVEQLSELGRLEKLQVVVDTADRIFFQSTATGCIGNGTLAPHADGKYLVYDASVLIEGCTGRFERLNGAYGGLATWTNDNRWWPFDDANLLMYLGSFDTASPRALTMYGPAGYSEQ